MNMKQIRLQINKNNNEQSTIEFLQVKKLIKKAK